MLVAAAAARRAFTFEGPGEAHSLVLVFRDNVGSTSTQEGVDGGVATRGEALHELVIHERVDDRS